MLSLMSVEEGTLIKVTQVNNVFALNACFKLTIFAITNGSICLAQLNMIPCCS